MATRTEMRAALLRRLGNRPDVTPADLDKWLLDGMVDLTTRRVTLQSLEKVGAAITVNPGDTYFLRPADCFAIWYIEDTTNKKVLDRFAGEMREFLVSRQAAASTQAPKQFIEYADRCFVGPQPYTATAQLIPYYYARATWGSGLGDSPSIETEWHYAIELVAWQHAARDIEDETRAAAAEQEFQGWYAMRDTSRKMQARFNVPIGGVKPHPSLRIGRSVR